MSKLRLIQVVLSIVGLVLTFIGAIKFIAYQGSATLMIIGIILALSTYLVKLLRFLYKD